MSPTPTDHAASVDFVMLYIVGISVILLLGITSVMIYFVFKYNRKKGHAPVDIHGNIWLEIIWIVIPTALVLSMFYFGYTSFREIRDIPANPFIVKVREYTAHHYACEAVVISAQIESDLIDLSEAEAKEFLKELGVNESGVGALIRGTYHLLGLRTYFTAGEKEVRAWTIHAGDTAPKAAGVIHSDFERGFIKAETVAYEALVQCGSVAAAREKGLYRMEGKEYVVKDGDVLLFKFNV